MDIDDQKPKSLSTVGQAHLRKPNHCGVGSCDKTPLHDGIHRCRCGKPVDEPAPYCAWHKAPEPDTGLSGIPITSNSRGFHVYGDRVSTDYGAEVRVYESSAASGPHVWMSVTPGSVQPGKDGVVTAHMDVNQTRAVIARLQAWLDEIPTRWASSTDG